jgi:hypothetical protein
VGDPESGQGTDGEVFEKITPGKDQIADKHQIPKKIQKFKFKNLTPSKLHDLFTSVIGTLEIGIYL